ncbi:MAG: oligosaccharide flippase family protein [Cyanobacteria bacterium J06634_6]
MVPKLSLKKRALSGSLWTVLGYGTQQALRFAGNVVLTRLLEPELFGLMALMTSLRIGLELFSDVGLGHNIIQNEKGNDPLFYNTAWTVQIIRGFVLWGISLLLVLPIASFYQEERLLFLFPIVGFTTVIDGLVSTSGLLLKKDMRVGLVTLNKLGAQIISLLVMITWAKLDPSYWALIAGTLCSAGANLFISHVLLPGPPNRLCWDKAAVKEIFGFGKWIFVATALFFLADQADRLTLAKLFSLETVGVYVIAYTLANMPRQMLNQMSSQVIFPAFTKRKSLPRKELKTKIRSARRQFLIVVALGLALISAFGDFFITLLYDARYENAAWMFSILCFGVWFSILTNISINALLAFGKPAYNAYAYASRLAVLSAGIYWGSQLFGLVGFVCAVSISDLGAYLGIQYGLHREKIAFPKQDLLATGLFVIFTAVFLWIRWLAGWGLPLEFPLTTL